MKHLYGAFSASIGDIIKNKFVKITNIPKIPFNWQDEQLQLILKNLRKAKIYRHQLD